VSPARFSALSLLSSLGWAAAVMAIVAWIGPASLSELGMKGWWAVLVPAAGVLVFGWWLGRNAASPTTG
jgi:membrane protein DedA with SNARE-associated domain